MLKACLPAGVKDTSCIDSTLGTRRRKGCITHLACSETFGVTMTTMLRVVPWRFKLLATTVAPMQYESVVARVTKASAARERSDDRIRLLYCTDIIVCITDWTG